MQDAFANPNTPLNEGTNEIVSLDVIGYNVAVPEPGTISLVAMGLITLAFGIRARRRKLA